MNKISWNLCNKLAMKSYINISKGNCLTTWSLISNTTSWFMIKENLLNFFFVFIIKYKQNLESFGSKTHVYKKKNHEHIPEISITCNRYQYIVCYIKLDWSQRDIPHWVNIAKGALWFIKKNEFNPFNTDFFFIQKPWNTINPIPNGF